MIPGPPLTLIGYCLVLFIPDTVTPEWYVIAFWSVIMIAITVVDNLLPAWGTKKYGGTKYGMWGSVIGLFVGLSFFPIGLVVGPFLGAFIGEKIAGQNSNNASKAGVGSFLGLMAGMLLKLIACGFLTYQTVKLML
ncbi:DUF456 domain-containing protein [Halosquirtibacter xylanolyticus]|uniref:DUF456 domain-containing protein n=1 Tax=Halosquirtibacter xylanolyticus TaxID=3374599 RepID=UPI00374A0BD2|nr:DUF456 domain-containing protein [Prolixibacteraceae bacterium]